jgi:hypothetical protein
MKLNYTILPANYHEHNTTPLTKRHEQAKLNQACNIFNFVVLGVL